MNRITPNEPKTDLRLSLLKVLPFLLATALGGCSKEVVSPKVQSSLDFANAVRANKTEAKGREELLQILRHNPSLCAGPNGNNECAKAEILCSDTDQPLEKCTDVLQGLNEKK